MSRLHIRRQNQLPRITCPAQELSVPHRGRAHIIARTMALVPDARLGLLHAQGDLEHGRKVCLYEIIALLGEGGPASTRRSEWGASVGGFSRLRRVAASVGLRSSGGNRPERRWAVARWSAVR